MGIRNPFRRKPAPARRSTSTPNRLRSTPSTQPIQTADNLGSLSINTQGHVAFGIGAGLAVDAADGSVGVQMGGFTVDTPSYDPSPSYCDPTPSSTSYDSGSSYSSGSYDSGSSYSSSDSGSSYSSCD